MTEIQKSILWLAIEDYSGLWEVLWELSSRFPGMSETDRTIAGQEAVRELYARGWIEIYRCIEPDLEREVLPKNEFNDVLRMATSWREPVPGGKSIRIGATMSGENELSGNR